MEAEASFGRLDGLVNVAGGSGPIGKTGWDTTPEEFYQDALWAAIADGTIDIIATDHAPHEPEEKTRADIWQTDCWQ